MAERPAGLEPAVSGNELLFFCYGDWIEETEPADGFHQISDVADVVPYPFADFDFIDASMKSKSAKGYGTTSATSLI